MAVGQRDDIRVRLVPDGDKAVIDALRKVRAEAELAGRSGTSAFAGMAPAISNIKGLLGTLGFTATAAGLVAFTKHVTDFADEVGKASQRTGSSSENFSTLAFAASTANVEIGQLETALQRLVKSLGGLQQGTLEQVDAFDKLALTAADFAGKDSVEAFDLIAQRLVKVKDETERVRIAISIFGKAGANLIPLLNDVGTKGFDKVREAAEKMGLVLSSDLTNAAQDANDAFTLMGEQVKGLAVQFIGGLARSVTDAMTTFQDETAGKGVSSMAALGAQAGKTAALVIGAFKIMATNSQVYSSAISAALSGEFRKAASIITERTAGNIAELKKLLADFKKEPPVIEPKVRPNKREIQETADSIKKQIDNKLADLGKSAGIDDFKELEKQAQKRAQIQEDEIKAQQALTEARAAAGNNQLAREAAITVAAEGALRARIALTRKAYLDEISLSDQKAEALNRAVDSEVEAASSRALLKTEIAKRSNQEQLASAQGYYSKLLSLNAEWLNRYKTASDAIRSIDKERADNALSLARFNREVDQAGLTEAEKFSAKKREALELEEQQKKAIAAGDSERAKQLLQEGIAVAKELAGLGAPRLAKDFAEEFTSRQDAFLAKQKQALEAQKSAAQQNLDSISKQFEEIKAKITEFKNTGLADIPLKLTLNQPEFDALMKSISDKLAEKPFPIGVAAWNVSGAGGAPGLASGGRIPGMAPHPRADNKLIWATPGEFMQPVAAVRHYGLDFMEQVRRMQLPRMAEGGVVGGAARSPAGAGGPVVRLDLTINRRALGPISGSRETIDQLVEALSEVAAGT